MGIVEVVGGVDTHADFHVAAAVDANGGVINVERFPASVDDYEALVAWLAELGQVTRVGVEGTGSYGVGLARFLIDADVEVVEVDRQNRQVRRKKGKSDPTGPPETWIREKNLHHGSPRALAQRPPGSTHTDRHIARMTVIWHTLRCSYAWCVSPRRSEATSCMPSIPLR
jgi:hypothetical protein